jgi:hypothetical protein
MTPAIDTMEVRCIFYVKVRMFDQREQSKFYVFTIISFGIVTLTVGHYLHVSVCFV